MKIEMGESLVYSYLRHEKNCLISQTNWKPSSNWAVNSSVYEFVENEFNNINKHPEFSNLFKSNFEQTIKQSEIDVLGISATGNIYAFEVAFHENGLQYGSKTETRNRVFKKLLRGYLVLKLYFPNYQHNICFCSPKVNPATESHIKEYFELLNREFSKENITFSYYSNQTFNFEILEKTLSKTLNEADSSELFSRSVKLLNISNNYKKSSSQKHKSNHKKRTILSTHPISTEPILANEYIVINNTEIPLTKDLDESVQDYVKRVMSLLFDKNLLSDSEIKNLQDKEYSKKNFYLDLPLLREIHMGHKDSKGHGRYWSKQIFGNKYYISKEWWKDHEAKYLAKIRQWLILLESKNT